MKTHVNTLNSQNDYKTASINYAIELSIKLSISYE